MRQRLGIAAALVGDPRVLILDEPANGLDPEGIRWMRELLQGMAEQGRTVLVSSHLLSEMQTLADDVVILAAGRLVRQGPMADVIESMSGSARVRVRTPEPEKLSAAVAGPEVTITPGGNGMLLVAGAPAARIGDTALAAGVALHELVTERPDLEDVFLELTQGKAVIR
jgi:ABC-2 type transport system ATP-binding protein